MPNELLSYEALDTLADLYNPILLLCAILSVFTNSAQYSRRWRSIGTGFAELAFYLIIVYGLMFLDIRFGLWPSLGWDYSTHTAFAIAMIWPLWLYHKHPIRWVWPASFLGYATLMVYQNYHTPIDILSTAGVISVLITGLQKLIRPQTVYFTHERTS